MVAYVLLYFILWRWLANFNPGGFLYSIHLVQTDPSLYCSHFIKLLTPETFRLYYDAIIGHITNNLIQPSGDLAQSVRKYVF